jgi:heme o synthase
MSSLFVSKLRLFFQVTKPGISRAQVLTVSIGYFLAKQSLSLDSVFFLLIVATYLLSSAACIANNLIETQYDAQMERTKHRALPAQVMTPIYGIVMMVLFFLSGLFFVSKINGITVCVSLLTVFIYVALYTPLKRLSWTNTLVGALPGALPLLGGWVATGTPIHLSVIALTFTLFSWQMPHFYALAIMYYDDYKVAGFKMLPIGDVAFRSTKRQVLLFTVLMVISSVCPYFIGFLSDVYFFGIIIVSFVFIFLVIRFLNEFNKINARKLFFLSIIYLPLWFFLILLDIIVGGVN